MAGTAKHYVLNDGSKFYFDHAAIPVAITHVKTYYGGSGLRATRDKGTGIVAALQALKGPWRARLLAVWKELKPLFGSNMSLTEYRVRPGASKKGCRFRHMASGYRSFKPKNPVKIAKPPALRVATGGTLAPVTAIRMDEWRTADPEQAPPPRNRNPYRTAAFLLPQTQTRRPDEANGAPVPAAPDARTNLQERIAQAHREYRAIVDTLPHWNDGEL